jgi:type II secretory pathway component PulF
MTALPNRLTFAYAAQTHDGRPMNGTVDAPHMDAAMQQLQSIGLRVTEMQPVTEPRAQSRKPLGADEFLAFNDQLAHMAKAGMPLEQGLRLMASDLKRGPLAETIRAIAAELERGVPLPDAVAKCQSQFPPLYAQMIDAGARTGDLSAILLNVGKHEETVQHLRASLWRAVAYPLMVTIALCVVLVMMSLFIFPIFEQTFHGFGFGSHRSAPLLWWSRARGAPQPSTVPMPPVTQALFYFAMFVPLIVGAVLFIMVLAPLIWRVMRATGKDAGFSDSVLFRLPLFGKALKMSLLARWCDTLRLAAVAGLDLPSAIKLSGDVVRSPALKRDSDQLVAALERGQSLDTVAPTTELLPRVVPPMIELAARSSDLPAALQTLATLYQQQAEIRIRTIPMILTPILMTIVALFIGFVLVGLLMPMLKLVNYLSGGSL